MVGGSSTTRCESRRVAMETGWNPKKSGSPRDIGQDRVGKRLVNASPQENSERVRIEFLAAFANLRTWIKILCKGACANERTALQSSYNLRKDGPGNQRSALVARRLSQDVYSPCQLSVAEFDRRLALVRGRPRLSSRQLPDRNPEQPIAHVRTSLQKH